MQYLITYCFQSKDQNGDWTQVRTRTEDINMSVSEWMISTENRMGYDKFRFWVLYVYRYNEDEIKKMEEEREIRWNK